MKVWNDYYSLFAVADLLRGNNPGLYVCQRGHRFVRHREGGIAGYHKPLPGPQHECTDDGGG